MVAIELAASWNPFRKSNASAIAIRSTIAPKLKPAASIGPVRLRVFQHDAFDQVRDILALVRYRLEQLIDFLQLDDLLGVRFLAEKLGHRRVHDVIGFGFQAIDIGADFQDRVGIAHRFEFRHRLLDFGDACDTDFGQPPGLACDSAHVVEKQTLRDLLYEIEDIVHASNQLVNLVAIEGGDERLVQQRDRLVRDVVGLLFVALDVPAPQLEVADVLEQRLELGGGEDRKVGMLVEEIEELSFTAQKADHRSLYSIAGRRDYRTASVQRSIKFGLCKVAADDHVFCR